MYIGSHLDDQLWLAMVPTALFSCNNPNSACEWLPILNGNTTALSTPHQLMLVMFFAHVLSTIPLDDMHSMEAYPDPLTWQSVRDSTDITWVDYLTLLCPVQNHCPLCMHKNQYSRNTSHIIFQGSLWWNMPQLHTMPKWSMWTSPRVQGSLAWVGWEFSPLLEAWWIPPKQHPCWGYSPLWSKSACNGPWFPHTWKAQLAQWPWLLPYPSIYLFPCHSYQVCFLAPFPSPPLSNFSATSCLIVDNWIDIPLEQIRNHNPVLYDSHNEDIREEVDLDNTGLLNVDGCEINVYDDLGFCVPRCSPVDCTPCGALLDLECLHELFAPEDYHGRVPNNANFTMYPLAFTKTLGNVQSPSIMPIFSHWLEKVDAVLCPPIPEETTDSDLHSDSSGAPRRGASVITGIKCQVYNSLSHRIRNEAKFHFVQLGMVTSALAGSGVKSVPHKAHWSRWVRFCEQGLPHNRFSQKISGDGQPQDLRFENTYIIDVHRMIPQHRKGSWVFMMFYNASMLIFISDPIASSMNLLYLPCWLHGPIQLSFPQSRMF